jgi:hypothetical protein
MPTDEEFEALKGRIVELENQLAKRGKSRVTDLTPEEIDTFQKVREVIASDFGDFCGVNDCMSCVQLCIQRCVQLCVARCIQVCIFECTCGPCNVGNLGSVAATRFGSLGG